VQIHDGDGRIEVESDIAGQFQLSLQDIARHQLRTASVLRTSFTAQEGVRAVFGDVGTATQKVGFPYPLPVLVLDRYGNVAEEWEGDVPVTMTGAARVAGRAPEIFRVVGGRATLPVLTTIAETCTFTLGEEAIIDVDAVTANTNLQQHPMATTIHFIAADVHHLVLSVATVEPDSSQHDVAVMGKGPAPSVGAAVNDISVDGEVSSRPLTPTSLTAGHDVLVSVKALDAYSNLVPQQEVSVFLEAELKPIYDENLTNANLSQQAKDPAQK